MNFQSQTAHTNGNVNTYNSLTTGQMSFAEEDSMIQWKAPGTRIN